MTLLDHSPSSLGVPHPDWRPHQFESYERIRDSEHKFIFVEAPTGTGKTTLATALGSSSKVTALMSTLGLIDQYEREYGWTVIKGRPEYLCADLDKIADWGRYNATPTAFDCHMENMYECDFAFFCPYLKAKKAARYAQRLAMTYKYASLAYWPRDRSGILVCDEGHATADEILDSVDFLLTGYQFKRYKIPTPRKHFSWRVQELMTEELRKRAESYLKSILDITQDYEHKKDRSPRDSANWRFHLRVENVLKELSSSWFLDASFDRFQLRPLDARPIAKTLWGKKSKVVFMSATIGDPEPLALELGVDSYDSFSTPHLIPKSKRPVHVIFNRRMTKKNRDRKPGLYRAQAYAIGKFIQEEIPPEWRGLILTTSYYKIDQLQHFLSLSSVADRLWQAPSNARGVSRRIAAFLTNPSPSIIAIDTIQGWGHGLDLRGDLGRFIVVAGVPHYNPSDPFDRARLERPGGMRYARWTAYNAVVQACGRVTRGIRVNGEYMLNVAALADGSCVSPASLRYYPSWFKEAMNGGVNAN